MLQVSQHYFTTRLQVDIEPSKHLRSVVFFAYALVIIVALSLPLSALSKAFLVIFAGLYGHYLIYYKLGSDNRSSIRRIDYTAQRGWRLHEHHGAVLASQLRLPVLVTPFLIIAQFGKGFWASHTLVIPVDAVEPRTFRHLRVRLLQSAYGHRNRT